MTLWLVTAQMSVARAIVPCAIATLIAVLLRKRELQFTRTDVVLVPGGFGQTAHMSDGPVHEWLRAADRTSTWTTSVCTGS